MRKDVFFYFKKSIAFFDLKARSIPPAVFLAILALYALYFFIMQIDTQSYNLMSTLYQTADGETVPVQMSGLALVSGLAIMLLINLVSFVYLEAAVREAKDEEYTAAKCVNAVFKYFFRLSGVTILKNILMMVGIFLLFIPAIYFAILLIFAECAVLDRNKAVVESLKFSGVLTNKRRWEIFKIELFVNLILAFFIILLLIIFNSSNLVVFQYISLFAISLCTLIELKLVAYLYADAINAYDERDKAAVAAARASIKAASAGGAREGDNTRGNGGNNTNGAADNDDNGVADNDVDGEYGAHDENNKNADGDP